MMKKWMKYTTIVTIGSKAVVTALVWALLSSSGCERETSDVHVIIVENRTDDTLVYNNYNGSKAIFSSSREIAESILYPDSTITLLTTLLLIDKKKALEEELMSPLASYFQDTDGADSCWFYYYDDYLKEKMSDTISTWFGPPPRSSLAVVWDAPLRTMDDSIHHFCNRRSWDVITQHTMRSNPEYHLRFTITEDDLQW